MTDSALRALERRLACGDHTARAQLLAARLRSGELDLQRLRLAAEAGDPDVATVLPELRHARALGCRWSLYMYGKIPCVVAAAAAARLLVPLWERLGHASAVQAVVAAEAWIECPCEPCRRRAAVIAAEIEVPSRTTGDAPYLRPACDVARAASRPSKKGQEQVAAFRAQRDLYHLLDLVLNRNSHYSPPRVAQAAREVGVNRAPANVKQVVEGALRAWALR